MSSCKCAVREEGRYAHALCTAFHDAPAVGYVLKSDGSRLALARLPYRTPTLHVLGTVEELTKARKTGASG